MDIDKFRELVLAGQLTDIGPAMLGLYKLGLL